MKCFVEKFGFIWLYDSFSLSANDTPQQPGSVTQLNAPLPVVQTVARSIIEPSLGMKGQMANQTQIPRVRGQLWFAYKSWKLYFRHLIYDPWNTIVCGMKPPPPSDYNYYSINDVWSLEYGTLWNEFHLWIHICELPCFKGCLHYMILSGRLVIHYKSCNENSPIAQSCMIF